MLSNRSLPKQREGEMTNRCSPPALPMAPVDLMAVAVGDCQVILAWTECGTGGLGFSIERADVVGPCGSFEKIGGVGPHVAAFRDGSVKPRTTYFYRVHAWNVIGDSAPSNVAEVTTPQAAMGQPADKG